jgi:hypothetical protein
MTFKSIALAVTTLVVSISANAAVITENFTSTALGGVFDGTVATGSFTYDDSLITGSGIENITAAQGLTLQLTVFGQIFTEQDDFEYSSGLPQLDFDNGSASFLNFVVSEQNGDITDINQVGVSDFGEFTLNPAIGGGYEGNFTIVSAVPVPAAAWLFGSGLIGLIGIARRKKS